VLFSLSKKLAENFFWIRLTEQSMLSDVFVARQATGRVIRLTQRFSLGYNVRRRWRQEAD